MRRLRHSYTDSDDERHRHCDHGAVEIVAGSPAENQIFFL
ncbi:hypothetical protein L195_g014939, partial [Trifolium pratense]